MDRIAAKERAKAIMTDKLGTCVGANILSGLTALAPFSSAPSRYGQLYFYIELLEGKNTEAADTLKGFNLFSRAVMLEVWQYLLLICWSLPSVALFLIAAALGVSSAYACLLLPIIVIGSNKVRALFGTVFSLLVFISVAVGDLESFVSNSFGIFAPYIISYIGISRSGGYGFGIFCIVLGCLWLLFVGYKRIQYSFSFYTLAQHQELTAKDCLTLTVDMTNAYYDQIIITVLSFLGWDILSNCLYGVPGVFYVTPYKELTYAEIYRQISCETGGIAAVTPTSTSAVNGSPVAPAAHAGDPKIQGIRGMYAGASFDIAPGETVVIGRDGSCSQIVIVENAAKVSRRHCGVFFDKSQNTYRVTDYSSNGTCLGDGTKLPKDFPQAVPRGTVIFLGDQSNSFRLQ